MSAPIAKSDKYVDELLGDMVSPTEEDEELPRGQASEVSGSEDGPPEIQPMAEDENAEMPAAAYANDKIDIVETPSISKDETEDEAKTEAVVEMLSVEATEVEAEGEVETPEKAQLSREAGLRAEIVRLRAENKKDAVLATPIAQPIQPGPGVVPSQSGPGAELPNIPGAQVVVSEDGSQVYLPDDEINRRVDERMRAAMQPTPQQQAVAANQQMEMEFAALNPETNTAAVQKFRDVDEFLGLKLAGLQAKGYVPQSVPELTHALRSTGVAAEFEQFFPETAPMFDELIAAVSSQQPAWRRSILERMSATSPQDDSGEAIIPTPTLESVAGTPRSLARKGGSRSVDPKADMAQFKALEEGFHKDPVGFPPSKYARYKELGRKLGEDGFESI